MTARTPPTWPGLGRPAGPDFESPVRGAAPPEPEPEPVHPVFLLGEPAAVRPHRAPPPTTSASRLWPPPPAEVTPPAATPLGAGPAPSPRPLPRAGRRVLGRPRGGGRGALGLAR